MAKRLRRTVTVSDLEKHAEKRNRIFLKLREIYENCINEDDVSLRLMNSSLLCHKQSEELSNPPGLNDLVGELYLTKYIRNRDINKSSAKRVNSRLTRLGLFAPSISKIMQQSREDIDFIRGIIWLKSVISSMENVDVDDFYLHFHNQWKSIKSKTAFEHGTNTNASQNDCSQYFRKRKNIKRQESFVISNDLPSTATKTDPCNRIPLPSSPQRFTGYDMQLDSTQIESIIPDSISRSSSYSNLFDHNDTDISHSAIFEVQMDDSHAESNLHNISLDEESFNLTWNSHLSHETNASCPSCLSSKTFSLVNGLPEVNSVCSLNLAPLYEKPSDPGCNRDKASCLQDDSGFVASPFNTFNLPGKVVMEPSKKRIAKDRNYDSFSNDSSSQQNLYSSGGKTLDNTKSASQKEIDKREDLYLPSAWLSFNLGSLNVNEFILKSVEVILSHFENEEIAVAYMKRKIWDGTVEKEALNAILDFCEIFETESKTDKCSREIYLTLNKVLRKIGSSTEENKIILRHHHISILLEFCTCKNVCIKTMNYLIQKLKSFKDILSSIKDEDYINIVVNQLRLSLYALNICIKKYLLIFPDNVQTQEEYVPIIKLWKKELFDRQNVVMEESMEQRERSWIEVLEELAIICSEDFELFSEQAYKLMHLLNSKYK